jgi:hypothetical protein
LLIANESFVVCRLWRICCKVEKLRAAGAVILGKTNMHEIGMGTTGENFHYGHARNPYNTSYHTGGFVFSLSLSLSLSHTLTFSHLSLSFWFVHFLTLIESLFEMS